MLRIVIEMHSARTGKVSLLSEMTVALTALTPDHRFGSYVVELSKFGGLGKGIWRRGFVSGHDRVQRGPYELLYRALGAVLRGRVPEYTEPTPEQAAQEEVTVTDLVREE